MISDELLEFKKEKLIELGDRIHSEYLFCKKAINHVPENRKAEKLWYSSLCSKHTYSTAILQTFINSLPTLQKLSEEYFSFYVGKIAIINFLEIINSYEQNLTKLIKNNEQLKLLLENKIEEKLSLLDESWNNKKCNNNQNLKEELKQNIKNKKFGAAFTRKILKKEGIIDKTDFDILLFAWTIRNSMHNNFVATRDIEFSYPDIKTGKTYHFKYKEGTELYHPNNDLLGFHNISTQIQFIFPKIVQALAD